MQPAVVDGIRTARHVDTPARALHRAAQRAGLSSRRRHSEVTVVDEGHDAGDITRWLARWSAGEPAALERLLPQVYDELRRLAAHELRGHRHHDTLQPTALVHDVFVRLLGAHAVDIHDRKHLFTTAAKLMRQVLIDRARARQRDKRGGGHWQRVDFIEAMALPIDADTQIPALDEALTALAALDPRMAQIVELRCFTGLEVIEVANLLGIDQRTVYRDWAMARAWLKERLQP
jgi:RNA polymerase sigma factor (TIGR02999 family)